MNNYEFCTHWVKRQCNGQNLRILDYGCGAGTIILELRKSDIQAFGCDVFYDGGDRSSEVGRDLFECGTIRTITDCRIPFENDSFDLVISNQVMEHVKDLDTVLLEIQRVLRPGGRLLSLFPHREVWREGHCGIPFLHWFPQGSKTRVYYAALMRSFGLGHYKGTKSIMQWSTDFCEWLDNWTTYRSKKEIHFTYKKYFQDIRHMEDYWLECRLARYRAALYCLPKPVQIMIAEKLGGLVFVVINEK